MVKFASEETSLKAQLFDRFNDVSCVSPDSGEISVVVKSPPFKEREERFLRLARGETSVKSPPLMEREERELRLARGEMSEYEPPLKESEERFLRLARG